MSFDYKRYLASRQWAVVTLAQMEPRLAEIVQEMKQAQAEGNRARVQRLVVEHHQLAKETYAKYGRPA
jgi:hypothetical protein